MIKPPTALFDPDMVLKAALFGVRQRLGLLPRAKQGEVDAAAVAK